MDGAAPKPTDRNGEPEESTIITPHPVRYQTTPLVSPIPSPQPPSDSYHPILAFRTRIGRNNRRWLDRRLTSTAKAGSAAALADLDPIVADRMKYDSDNDEDDGEGGFAKDLLYPVDHYSDASMELRAAAAAVAGGLRRESTGQDARRIASTVNGSQVVRSGS